MSVKSSIFRYADFNIFALLEHAETLRGSRCTCDTNQIPMAGSHHWAIVLTFDNVGVDWIFRSPRLDNGMTEQIITKLIESEAASIKHAKIHGLPVVDIQDYR